MHILFCLGRNTMHILFRLVLVHRWCVLHKGLQVVVCIKRAVDHPCQASRPAPRQGNLPLLIIFIITITIICIIIITPARHPGLPQGGETCGLSECNFSI